MENIPRGMAHPFCWLNEERHYLFLVLFSASFPFISPLSILVSDFKLNHLNSIYHIVLNKGKLYEVIFKTLEFRNEI